AGHAARRLGDHRDDLRVARRGAALGAGHLQPRLSSRPGRGLPARVDVRAREPAGRLPLHLSRPADSPAMTTATPGAGPQPLVAGAATEALRERARATAALEWLDLVRRLVRRRTALFGAIVVAVVIATALGAPWLSPFDPIAQDIGNRL